MRRYGYSLMMAMLLSPAAAQATALASSEPATLNDVRVGDVLQVTLTGDWVTPRVNGITLTLDGQTYGMPGSDHSPGGEGIWAGLYRIDVKNLAGETLAGNYPTVCLDVTVDPAKVLEEHNVIAASNSLKWLWGTYYDTINNDPLKAAAFQMAAWEIMHETSGTWNITDGNFGLYELTLTTQNSTISETDLTTQTNAYLNTSLWTKKANLLIVSEDDKQPFLIEVPEPLSLVILTLGAVAIVRRKSA